MGPLKNLFGSVTKVEVKPQPEPTEINVKPLANVGLYFSLRLKKFSLQKDGVVINTNQNKINIFEFILKF